MLKIYLKNILLERENKSKWERKSENELIVGSMSDCIKNIDENIDRLIDKITEMQNEVNSLASAIEKITN